MEKSFERKNNDEKTIISALAEEISNMEKNKPEIRKQGKGDLKYEILFRFVKDAKDKGFTAAYQGLNNHEKHAVITRLENQAREGRISYDFVEWLKKELYGICTDEEGNERIDYDKQIELEKILQDQNLRA